MPDGLSRMYASLVDGAYDCVDRIVLNAYFRFAQGPAGFRVRSRQLYGTDDGLDNAHLMRMAGRFRRRLRAWALANNTPFRSCRQGEQKHEIAEQYREQKHSERTVPHFGGQSTGAGVGCAEQRPHPAQGSLPICEPRQIGCG